MMKHQHTIVAALLAATAAGAAAQGFSLEGAVVDTRTSRSLGVVSERGDINALFRAQKAMTFGILRSAGISLEQLPPEVRSRIERFATTNLEAFRAFSAGLDLKDQGKFVEAKAEFARAAELDPNFALAAEQQQAMPDVNLGTGIQTRAVMLAVAGAAVDRGKASFTVDSARAVAALAAGQSVIAVTLPSTTDPATTPDFTTTPPGSGAQFAPNIVAGLAYTVTLPSGTSASVANAAEWRSDAFRLNGEVLDALGNATIGFQAQRQNATAEPRGSTPLADGSIAYWGAWLSTPAASATVTVTVEGQTLAVPQLGPVDYAYGEATRSMPTTGTAVFRPEGGSLGQVSGTVAVNFVTRGVELQNLGFNIGNLTFSGLNGSASYGDRVASGTFSGEYRSGSCIGCTAFTFEGSRFGGSFIGRDADGLVFSTFLRTGGGGSAAGVHVFKQP
jgi:hypothetical protein